MLRAAFLAAVLFMAAGCASFHPVGSDKFKAEASEIFDGRSDIVYYATGTWGQPGVYFMNGVPMPRQYPSIIALTESGLIIAGAGFQPRYHLQPYSKLGPLEVLSGRIGTVIQEKTVDGKVRTFFMIEDDGVLGTSSKEKTLAFYQRMQELMAKDRAKQGTQLQNSPSRS